MKRAMLLCCMLLAGFHVVAYGQTARTKVALTGFTGNFGNVALADFAQGYRESATDMTYTVSITRSDSARTATLSIRSADATLGGVKPISAITWKRIDQSTWNTLTTSDVQVDSQPIVTDGSLFTNSITFRCAVALTDAPATLTATMVFTLQISAP